MFWDPAVVVSNLLVSSTDQRVTLTGSTATYGMRLEAKDAAYRVGGVREVENDITVDPSKFGLRTDETIAADVRTALVLDYAVPDDRISVSVLDGTVMLSGGVDWYYQRLAASNDAAMITGVTFVDNQIAVTQPEPSATDISSGLSPFLSA